MFKSKKIAKIGDLCVACGVCVKECPLRAITIQTGIKAKVCLTTCVGCGKCSKACPASVIGICDREVLHER